jgi:hypothetical protein
VLTTLQQRGLLDPTWPAVFDRAATDRSGRAAATRTAEPGWTPDPYAQRRVASAELGLSRRSARPSSIQCSSEPADTLSLRGCPPDLPSEPPGRSAVKHGIGIRVPSE